MADALEFPYRPKMSNLLTGLLAFAALTAALIYVAANNDSDLEIGPPGGFRSISLSIGEATVFYWCLAFVVFLPLVMCIIGIVRWLAWSGGLRLTESELSAPKSGFCIGKAVIPLSTILDIGIQNLGVHRVAVIRRAGGNLMIAQRLFANDASFEQFFVELSKRVEAIKPPTDGKIA